MGEGDTGFGFSSDSDGGATFKKAKKKSSSLVVDSQPNAQKGLVGNSAAGVLFALEAKKWSQHVGKESAEADSDGICVTIRATNDLGHIVTFTASGNAATAAGNAGTCWEGFTDCVCHPCTSVVDASGSSSTKQLTQIFSTKDINYVEMVDETTTEAMAIGEVRCCATSEESFDYRVNNRVMLVHMHYGEAVKIPFERNLTEMPSTQRDCFCWEFGCDRGVDRSHHDDQMVTEDGTEITWKQTNEKVTRSKNEESLICGFAPMAYLGWFPFLGWPLCIGPIIYNQCVKEAVDDSTLTVRTKYSMKPTYLNKCHDENSTFDSLANILMLLAIEDRDRAGTTTRNAGIKDDVNL